MSGLCSPSTSIWLIRLGPCRHDFADGQGDGCTFRVRAALPKGGRHGCSIHADRTAPSTETAAEPTHDAEVLVSLDRLKASPKNARKIKHSMAAIEALAASIRGKKIERDGEEAATGNDLVTIGGEAAGEALRMLARRKAIKRSR